MKKRQTTKGKNSRKSTRPQKQFVMDGGASGAHHGGCVHNHHHVADYYRLERGAPDTAANLVRDLRPWAQVAVLGHRVVPGNSFSS
jgi:hypothetical protein